MYNRDNTYKQLTHYLVAVLNRALILKQQLDTEPIDTLYSHSISTL